MSPGDKVARAFAVFREPALAAFDLSLLRRLQEDGLECFEQS